MRDLGKGFSVNFTFQRIHITQCQLLWSPVSSACPTRGLFFFFLSTLLWGTPLPWEPKVSSPARGVQSMWSSTWPCCTQRDRCSFPKENEGVIKQNPPMPVPRDVLRGTGELKLSPNLDARSARHVFSKVSDPVEQEGMKGHCKGTKGNLNLSILFGVQGKALRAEADHLAILPNFLLILCCFCSRVCTRWLCSLTVEGKLIFGFGFELSTQSYL